MSFHSHVDHRSASSLTPTNCPTQPKIELHACGAACEAQKLLKEILEDDDIMMCLFHGDSKLLEDASAAVMASTGNNK